MTQRSTCPCCGYKFSTWETAQANNIQPFICPKCGASLRPVNLKSWALGYALGFIAASLPAKIYLHLGHGLVAALALGLTVAVVIIFTFAVYINKTTVFE